MEWMTTIDEPGRVCLMQGNEALVRGAVEAGIHYAASYPGSPSSQVLGMLGNIADKAGLYAEWSANESCALEACFGASFADARAMCIVKQNGLLVAGDALHCGAMHGVRGGLVLVTSDDPSAHSSTNELDSRHQAVSADLPMLEPTNIQEAKDFIPYAFELSEKLRQLVIVRVTTRICHSRGCVTLGELPKKRRPLKRIGEWDRMVCINWLHGFMLERLDAAREIFEESPLNRYEGPLDPETLIITAGTGRLYIQEAVARLGLAGQLGVLSLATLWPLPEKRIAALLKGARRVLVVEEVDPFLEEHVAAIAGRNGIVTEIIGRANGVGLPRIGELNPDLVAKALAKLLGIELPEKLSGEEDTLGVPYRDLTFCAGCPHRATFFVLKQALKMHGVPGVVVGDIGCYIMAAQRAGQFCFQFENCMGSGIAAAGALGQLRNYGLDQPVVAVVGDSTFFHTTIPGLISAKYHNANMLLLVLDNSATAMTGFQPHPGTGLTAMGRHVDPIDIKALLEAIGCCVFEADPFELGKTRELLIKLIGEPGLKVLILKQPCATLSAKTKKKEKYRVDPALCLGEDCGCGRFCSRVWGCPGNSWDFKNNKAVIDEVVCVGCGVCAKLCPAGAIRAEGGDGI
jgi:indolepyruvate ferredoxin oxidoreductase alpha subunit